MSLTPVHTSEAPAAVGPYSQAVRVGSLVFTSGSIALDPASGEMVGADAPSQTRQLLKNLAAVLKEAGSSPKKVCKTTVYLVDMADFTSMNEVYAEFFGDHRPARTTVAVRALPKGALVEVDAIAECTE